MKPSEQEGTLDRLDEDPVFQRQMEETVARFRSGEISSERLGRLRLNLIGNALARWKRAKNGDSEPKQEK